MKKIVLIIAMTGLYAVAMYRLLANAPQGGSVLSWIMAFALVFALIGLVAFLLNALARRTGRSQ
ncbi:hypothetical protein [Bosea sp. BIWAKO-01]|uniref:hypothetical protein n=1 Tax=Bosea sp. BIWAKO-01 TaxID=506668 RepID=UPI00085325B8|nr:hypothetical protein [Bosea sp. BIWAKO-01]